MRMWIRLLIYTHIQCWDSDVDSSIRLRCSWPSTNTRRCPPSRAKECEECSCSHRLFGCPGYFGVFTTPHEKNERSREGKECIKGKVPCWWIIRKNINLWWIFSSLCHAMYTIREQKEHAAWKKGFSSTAHFFHAFRQPLTHSLRGWLMRAMNNPRNSCLELSFLHTHKTIIIFFTFLSHSEQRAWVSTYILEPAMRCYFGTGIRSAHETDVAFLHHHYASLVILILCVNPYPRGICSIILSNW